MIDLFGPMLAVRVENNHELCLSILPMAQSGFDCLAFTAVLFVHDHFRAGFTRTLGGFVGRTVVDYENVIQLLPGPADNVANMLLLVIGGNHDSQRRADHKDSRICDRNRVAPFSGPRANGNPVTRPLVGRRPRRSAYRKH